MLYKYLLKNALRYIEFMYTNVIKNISESNDRV